MSITPNMQLVVPEVLVTTGPQYATQINTALDVVDAHDHSPGKGVRITPSGLNINTDLPFGNNAATGVKAVALQAQTSVLTTGAVYNKGGNLFYRDGSSNEIQLTSGGALNVSSVGAITGLTSPASASFVSLNSSFVFQNNVSTFAKLEIGDVLVYSRAGSVGTVQAVTLVADAATSAYSLRLPASAPLDNQIMRMKSATASQFVDLLGTTNQVTVTHNTSNITLSLPQSIHSGATPTFAGLTLTGVLGGTTATLSGQAQVGSLVSLGAVSGTTGAFTGNISTLQNISGFSLTLGGNVTMNNVGGTFSAPLISATFNDVTAGFVTANQFIAGSNSFTNLELVANSAKINVVRSQVSGAGLNIIGKTDGFPFTSGYIGQVVTASMGSNLNTSTGYQNLIAYTIPAGEWEVSANAILTWNVVQSTANIKKLEVAISLASGSADSSSYTTIQYFESPFGSSPQAGESVTALILSRRVNVSSPTPVYLVGRTQTAPGGTNNAYFDSLGTILKFQRVG